jgi:hypothetical protein
MSEKTLEVCDFQYLTESQDTGFLWDFKFKFSCKSPEPRTYHIIQTLGFHKNLIVARSNEQIFFTVSESLLSGGLPALEQIQNSAATVIRPVNSAASQIPGVGANDWSAALAGMGLLNE